MERVLQRSFKPSHYHTTGRTGGTFAEKKSTTGAEVLLDGKTLKVQTNYIRPEMLKTLNRHGVL